MPAVARSAKAGLASVVLSLIPFVLLATANSAGYRYGASDLAFYGPAVMRRLDPDLFPRDRPVLDAQANLTFMDETVAAIARRTTTHLPSLFLGLYIVTLVLLAAGIAAIGTSLYRHRWTVAALLAAFTIRHAITRSGTNSLEGYFHPRQLAFAFGIIAMAAFLRGRPLLAALALVGAGSLHPTTTLWFAVWLAVAIFATARVRWPFAVVVAAAGRRWLVGIRGRPARRQAHADGSRVARRARREGLSVSSAVAVRGMARQPRPTCRSSCSPAGGVPRRAWSAAQSVAW